MQQALVRAAVHVAAPRRLHPSLQNWLDEDQRRTLILSDDPRGLVTTLQGLPADDAVVVLASGDPLWFGIGRILADRLPADRLRFHPAPTALQLAFARIGRPWQDASWVSLHGREPSVLASTLQKRPKALAVLTDPQQGGFDAVRRSLISSGLEESYQLWACENLGHSSERVQRIEPGQASPADPQPLLIAVLILQQGSPAPANALPLFGIEDGVFLQHRPSRSDDQTGGENSAGGAGSTERGVWDSTGTGSVGLEACVCDPSFGRWRWKTAGWRRLDPGQCRPTACGPRGAGAGRPGHAESQPCQRICQPRIGCCWEAVDNGVSCSKRMAQLAPGGVVVIPGHHRSPAELRPLREGRTASADPATAGLARSTTQRWHTPGTNEPDADPERHEIHT